MKRGHLISGRDIFMEDNNMSLRDYFAAHAPANLLCEFAPSANCYPKDDPFPKDGNGWDYAMWRERVICRLRYAYADAMLAEREKGLNELKGAHEGYGG